MAQLLSKPFQVSSGRTFTAIPKALVEQGSEPEYDDYGEWFFAVSVHIDEHTHFRQSPAGLVEECPAGLLHVRYASADGERVVVSKFPAVEAPTSSGTTVTFRCVVEEGPEAFPVALAVPDDVDTNYGVSDVEREVLEKYHHVDLE